MPAGKLKPLRIEADHAFVESLRPEERGKFRQKRPMVKRVEKKQLPEGYSAAMTLASLLYPRIFPRQLASGLDRKTTFSKRIILDAPSQNAIEVSYAERKRMIAAGRFDSVPTEFVAHNFDVEQEAAALRERIMAESGIMISKHALNFGRDRNYRLVAFEVSSIDLERLKARVRGLPEGTGRQKLLKKQAFSLFEHLKGLAKGEKVLKVHAVGK